MNVIAWIAAGCLGGFLAGWFLKGDKEFNQADVVIGILGALVGGIVLRGGGFVWTTVTAFIGSVLVVWVFETITGRPAI